MRPPLWRLPGMRSLVAMTFTGFSGYAVLLPVAPLWARHGGAGTGGAGLVNGALLLATVLTQLLVPAALRRFGWGPVLAAGMALLGVPAVLYASSDALGPVLALSAVRGVGFGVLTVTGSAAVAALVGTERRGEAIGLYGLTIALPHLLLLPAGPWVAEHLGFGVVFGLGALPVVGIAAALRLATELHGSFPELLDPGGGGDAAVGDPRGAAALRLLRPAVLLTSVTVAGGAALTFAPQMVDDELLGTAGLFALGLVSGLARWRVGALADRYGVQQFLWPLMAVTAAGAALVAWSVAETDTEGPLLLAGLVVLGLAYGALQNLTLVAAFAAVSRRHHTLASAVWNIGFDAGTGLGSVFVGVLAQRASFTTAFVVVAALAVAVIPLAVVRPRSQAPGGQPGIGASGS